MRFFPAVLLLLLIATPYFAQGECPVTKVPTITELTVSRNEVSKAMEAVATLSYEDKARGVVRPLPMQDLWFFLCPISNATVAGPAAPCPTEQHSCNINEWNCTGGCCLDNPQIQVIKTNTEGKATALYPLIDASVIAEYKGGDAYLPSNSTAAYTKSALGFLNLTICMPLFIVLAMLMMSMMAMGRSPLSTFDFSAIKAPRAAQKSVQTMGLNAGAIVAAVKGVSGSAKKEAQKEIDKAQGKIDAMPEGDKKDKAQGKLDKAKAAMAAGNYGAAKSMAKESTRGTLGNVVRGVGRYAINPLAAVRDLAALPAKTVVGLATGGVNKARGGDFTDGYKQGSGVVGNAIKDPLRAVAGVAKFQAKTMVGLVTGVKGALASRSAKKGYAKGKEGAKYAGEKIDTGVKALETIRDIVSPMNLLKEMIGGQGIIGNWLANGFKIGGLRIALGGAAVNKMVSELMNYHAMKKNNEIKGNFEGYQELDRRREEDKTEIRNIDAKIARIDKDVRAAERESGGVFEQRGKAGTRETREELEARGFELVTERRELQEKVRALDSEIGELHEELEGKSLLAGAFGIEGVFAVQTVNRIVEREGKLVLEEDETFAGRKIPGALLNVFKALSLVAAVPNSMYIMKFEFGKLGLQGTTMSGIEVGRTREESDNEEILEELKRQREMVDQKYAELLRNLEGYKGLSDEIWGKLGEIANERDPVRQREMLGDFESKELPRIKTLSSDLAGGKEETGSP